MREIGTFEQGRGNENACRDMANYILTLLRGGEVKREGCAFMLTECQRQFFTWGGHAFRYIIATDGSYGLQFRVAGLKFRGVVRVWYDDCMDCFDVEFRKGRSGEKLHKEIEGLYLDNLHNVLHREIERDDDIEC